MSDGITSASVLLETLRKTWTDELDEPFNVTEEELDEFVTIFFKEAGINDDTPLSELVTLCEYENVHILRACHCFVNARKNKQVH